MTPTQREAIREAIKKLEQLLAYDEKPGPCKHAYRAKPTRHKRTMQKLAPEANLRLKDLAYATGVPMNEVLGYLIDAIDENRDALTRIARKHGAEHPWEAIRFLVK